MSRALICVDIQNDFCEGGSLAVAGGNDVAKRIQKELIDRTFDIVVATKDFHIAPGSHWSDTPDFVDSWPKHCEANTSGAEFNTAIDESTIDEVFYKGMFSASYSGFEGVNTVGVKLKDYLKSWEITEVDVVGLAFDYCVKDTAIDASELGFKTRVLSGYSAAVHNATQSILDVTYELEEAGVEVV